MEGMELQFNTLVQRHGEQKAIEGIGKYVPKELIDHWLENRRGRLASVRHGYPPKILSAAGLEPWYDGPMEGDRRWPAFRQQLVGRLAQDDIDKLDQSTSKVVAFTHDIALDRFLTKGLVVGHVQSGKTTSFTGVAAKCADAGYRLVIVLSGIHNGLRRQTQARLQSQLVDPAGDGTWFPLTDVAKDFHKPVATAATHLQNAESTLLVVVKKNKAPLDKLISWLRQAAKSGVFMDMPALIIDDEADQASVDTKAINPRIKSLIKLFPKCAYIGYTATPFANVLIDPAADDLYPETFILNLPEPAGYFGAQKIFGRDVLEGESSGPDLDGYDMIRIVPDDTVDLIRPVGKGTEVGFIPEITDELSDAIRYFLLATAARRCRNDRTHSTMLIHTGMKTAVHDAYREPIAAFLRKARVAIESKDQTFMDGLRAQWDREVHRVPAAEFANRHIPFDELAAHLPEVAAAAKVVIDNFRSPDRLVYSDAEPEVAVAVGGNTLSRGLTLEGLVVSFFVRTAKTYDTLMQMGRWFGFRPGYQDLPRIWMTEGLRSDFRHLATVEAEVRADIGRYEEQDISPREVGVRIRTHPVLNITAKMGAARIAYASYGGRRVQTRYFREHDAVWLDGNRAAAVALVGAAVADGAKVEDRGNGTVLLRSVDVEHILEFLAGYRVHGDSPDLDPRLVTQYVDKERRRSDPSLLTWNVAVVGAPVAEPGHVVDFGGGVRVGTVERSLMKGTGGDKADIKTLMSKEHRVVDMEIDAHSARRKSEGALVDLRNANPDFARRGLLLLYPIAKDSQPDPVNVETRVPMTAAEHVIGMALVFPGNAEDKVENRYVEVDTTGVDMSEYDEINAALADDQDTEE